MTAGQLNRRGFLKTALASLSGIAALRLARRRPAEGGEGASPHRWAMVIDQSKCTGCGYCVKACQAHNDIPPSISWTQVIHQGKVGDKDVYLPRPCMHCEHAPCVEVCPVKASYYRPDGIVMMDYDRCIGCRYCEVACPYHARSFNWEAFTAPNPVVPEWGLPEVPRRPRGVVEKCTFCYHRIDRGLQNGLTPGVDLEATPACVVACPVGARIFGDLNDPQSNVSKALRDHPHFRLRQDLGTAPRVYYLYPQAAEEETT